MKTSYLSLVFILLFFSGCQNYSKETIKLNGVLSGYNDSISHHNHLYIVRSKFYCNGCVQALFLKLENLLNSYDNKSITLVSYDQKHISDRLLSKVDFIDDTLLLINKEFPSFANLTIFETKEGKVVSFKNIGDSKNLDIPKFVTKYLEHN